MPQKVNKLYQYLYCKTRAKSGKRTGLFTMTMHVDQSYISAADSMVDTFVVVYKFAFDFPLFHRKVTVICCTQVQRSLQKKNTETPVKILSRASYNMPTHRISCFMINYSESIASFPGLTAHQGGMHLLDQWF